MNYKFRGKTAAGQWAYGNIIEYGKECHIFETENAEKDKNPLAHMPLVRPETVGQWIGQKDKNGNDGFCGDLVKHKDGTIYQIVFNTELASFCLKFSFGRSCCFNSFDRLNKLSEYDIIGNIHDNPELLEVK